MSDLASEKLLVILDLDETLVFADEAPLDRPADLCAGPYHVYKRPHVEAFVRELLAEHRVAVWTSGSASYAATLVPHLFPDPQVLAFVWGSERCTRCFDAERHEYYSLKDMKKVRKLGYDLDRVVVIDDTPQKHQRNYGNLVRVRPFTGQAQDDELLHLMQFLRWLARQGDIRQVEKRGWWRRMLA